MTPKSRTPAKLAADARAAYDQLTGHRPAGVSDRALKRHLSVLHIRMNNVHASNAQLAAGMDPPQDQSDFSKRIRRAIEVAGICREPHGIPQNSQLATDARIAYDRLIVNPPAHIGDDAMDRHLTVLAARMNHHHASNTELAAAMDPPQRPTAFITRIHRAIFVASQGDYASAKRTPRSPLRLATDSRIAYNRLVERRPSNISDDVYARYLAVLQARMNNLHASNAALAAAMDPPMSKNTFNAAHRRAINASTRKEKQPSPPPPRIVGVAGPNAARQAAEAAEALAVLQKRRPERITDDRYRTLLTVLTARKTNPTATYRELAIGLQPPLSTAGFYAALRTAHQLAGVGQTITPHHKRREAEVETNSAA